ncbi:MAG: erythromycin esterase family protein [Pseudomonadota bacterium]
MPAPSDDRPAQAIAAAAQAVRGVASDYDGLLALIGDAQLVLLGESTHGTHEFYAERARITQRLISELGFCGVVAEADWPDAYRINRYVRASSADSSAEQALSGFRRFPSWMWRNSDVHEFIDWLRGYNARMPVASQAGFYGLDLYSLYASIAEVLRYLDQVDPAAAQLARQRYACFDHYDEDSQAYGYAAWAGMSDSCRQGVIAQLLQLQQHAATYMQADGISAQDAFFHAQQNARLVVNAEQYYRTMFEGRVSSWNLRDSHMADTLDALLAHLGSTRGAPAKLVVWAHNSHLGDARATEARYLGEWNVGQLMRARHGQRVRLIGATTYDGWVTAASRWDGPAERKRVLPALPGSYEELLHQARSGNFVLPLTPGGAVAAALKQKRLERAIGVLYLPATERQSHYFFASLPAQFDAVLHIDRSTALTPLEIQQRTGGEVPETFPVGV